MVKILTSEYTMDLVAPQLDGMTDDDFFSFCLQNKHLKIERDENHQIIFMPPEGISSSNMGVNIATDLNNWNRSEKKVRHLVRLPVFIYLIAQCGHPMCHG